MKDFSTVALPLTELLKQENHFIGEIIGGARDAFERLKQLLTEPPVLTLFDPTLDTLLCTDASQVGLGAVLMQKTLSNEKRTIAFWSMKLNDTERRYHSTDLECMSVFKAIEHFKVYLDGRHFIVITDCACLSWLFNLKESKARLHRWAVKLSAYDFNVIHRPGSSNKVADALSRNPISLHLNIEEIRSKQAEIANYGCLKTRDINGLTHVRVHGKERLVIPPIMIADLLKSFHDDMNHAGIEQNDLSKILVPKEGRSHSAIRPFLPHLSDLQTAKYFHQQTNPCNTDP